MELLTYLEAAKLLKLKLGTLYALVSQNRIPHIRLGRRFVRFSRSELEAWLQQHRVTARDQFFGENPGLALGDPPVGSWPGQERQDE